MNMSNVEYTLCNIAGLARAMQWRIEGGQELTLFHVENMERTAGALRRLVEDQGAS